MSQQRFLFIMSSDEDDQQTELSSYICSFLDTLNYPFSYLKLSPTLTVNFGSLLPSCAGEAYVTQDGGEVDYDVGIIERSISCNLTRDSCLSIGQAIRAVYEAQEASGDTGYEYLTIEEHLAGHIADYMRTRPALLYGEITRATVVCDGRPTERPMETPIRVVELGGNIFSTSTQVFVGAMDKVIHAPGMDREDCLVLLTTHDERAFSGYLDTFEKLGATKPDFVIHLENMRDVDLIHLNRELSVLKYFRATDTLRRDVRTVQQILTKWNYRRTGYPFGNHRLTDDKCNPLFAELGGNNALILEERVMYEEASDEDAPGFVSITGTPSVSHEVGAEILRPGSQTMLGDLVASSRVAHRVEFELRSRSSSMTAGAGARPPSIPDLHDLLARVEVADCEVAFVGKFVERETSYLSIIEALKYAAKAAAVSLRIRFLNSMALDAGNVGERLSRVDGLLIPGGFGQCGQEGIIAALEYARTHAIPALLVCLGMQLGVIEYARHVAGMDGADSSETAPATPYPVVHSICRMVEEGVIPPIGKERSRDTGGPGKYSFMRLGDCTVRVAPGTLLARCYGGAALVTERHWHSYALNSRFLAQLKAAGMVIGGMDEDDAICLSFELPGHPFYLGVQYHPEFSSKHMRPHGIYVHFMRAVGVKRSGAGRGEAKV